MQIALIYHKHPYQGNPRGGELSVRSIVEYLKSKGHDVFMSHSPSGIVMGVCDIVLTWGKPTQETAYACGRYNIPLVVMVRFWRNVAPLPAGNLMNREIDQLFARGKKMIFDTAKAIITNTEYSRKVIERWQPTAKGKVHVCYVPVMGEFEQSGDEKGALTIVTPEIYGELNLVRRLNKELPNERFLIVNAQYYNASQFKEIENVKVCNYMEMDEVWSQTKALLVPVYENDVCGTRRTTIEAMRNGVPVIALNRCGMDEKVPSSMRVPGNATYQQWVERIEQINENYQTFQKLAKSAWEKYDTQKELERFEQILMQ